MYGFETWDFANLNIDYIDYYIQIYISNKLQYHFQDLFCYFIGNKNKTQQRNKME